MKITSVFRSLLISTVLALGWTPEFVHAAVVDSDGDGVNDYREIKDGTATNNPNSFDPLSKGLVAYYTFNGNANDESGHRNDLSLNFATFGIDRFGRNPSALTVQTSVGIAAESTKAIPVTGNTDRTIAFWTKFAPVMDGSTSVGIGWGTNQENGNASWLGVIGDGRMIFWGHYADLETQASTVQSGDWQHVAVVYSGSLVTAKFYINGLETLALDAGALQEILNTVGTTLKVGPWTLQGSSGTLNGASLDDVRVYNRSLWAHEVFQLYAFESGTNYVTRRSQRISSRLPTRIYYDSPYALAPRASSGLGLTYEISDPTAARIDGNPIDGYSLRILKVEPFLITVRQWGNLSYLPTSRVILVNPLKRPQNIAFTPIRVTTVGGTINVIPTINSPMTVSITSSDPTILRVNADYTATALRVGRVVLTATQGGNEYYAPAKPIKKTVTVR